MKQKKTAKNNKNVFIVFLSLFVIFMSVFIGWNLWEKKKGNNLNIETTKISKVIKSNLRYTLPDGWIAKVEIQEFVDNTSIEVVTINNGDYILEMGKQSTGESRCDEFYNANTKNLLKQLNNLSLGRSLSRQSPNLGIVFNKSIKLNVCSIPEGMNKSIYTTNIGQIEYLIPIKYEMDKILQMDKIVESIKF